MTPTTEWFYREGELCKKPVTPTLRADTATHKYVKTCTRCGGAGGADKWNHTGWTCFDCGGSGNKGVGTVKVYTRARLDQLNVARDKSRATAEKKRQEKNAQAQAELEARRESYQENMRSCYPDIMEFLDSLTDDEIRYNSFLHSVTRQVEAAKELSEPVISVLYSAVIPDVLAKREDDSQIRDFESRDGVVVEGRQDITAILLSIKEKDCHWNGRVYKALFISDQGVKLWGSVPQNVDYDLSVSRGKLFTFKATVEASKDDPKFGFYKRPTKAQEAN